MDTKNFAIGVLSTTAAILFVGLLIIHTRPQPAWADGMTIVGKDYAMAVGAITRNDEDLLYLIDAPMEILNVYRFDSRSGQILLVQLKVEQTDRIGQVSGVPCADNGSGDTLFL